MQIWKYTNIHVEKCKYGKCKIDIKHPVEMLTKEQINETKKKYIKITNI